VNGTVQNGDGTTIYTTQTAKEGPLFRMNLYEDFYPKVSKMHKSLLSGAAKDDTNTSSSRYDPN